TTLNLKTAKRERVRVAPVKPELEGALLLQIRRRLRRRPGRKRTTRMTRKRWTIRRILWLVMTLIHRRKSRTFFLSRGNPGRCHFCILQKEKRLKYIFVISLISAYYSVASNERSAG